MTNINTPGKPSSVDPDLQDPEEQQQPRQEHQGPAPAKADQSAPAVRSATGQQVGDNAETNPRAQADTYLTTSQGTRVRDTHHSLKAGERGPTLLQDHHLREKITHFDHERIPERVVHARGAAAHGTFESYGVAGNITRARFLTEKQTTPVFTRFSTVVGSRGSADAVRDTRGFATKFYTDEGTFDLVGNNIPVFFIQDGIKFPDVVHAAKPHPDREIPQAQSAHDTFWDFVSLHTEAQAHAMWQMSDRGIPRSFRMMEGFGVNTFRLINAADETVLVKFHWKPRLGVHSLTWEEAQMVNGVDPDFHRRDLADAIESGAYPQWELGVQVFPDTEDEMFEGIDLLDPTKIVPEELAEVQPLGLLTLNANPSNYFAETEQVAFHPGHLVPGIDITNDPLLQARMFSYVDTQLTRLGGPNFAQIPINRPHTETNDMLRDGFHQHAVHEGVAPYKPNSLDGGCPFFAGAARPGNEEHKQALIDIPQKIAESTMVRRHSQSFDDHFSQATMFYRSLTPVEQEHTAQGYAFELGKCYETTVRQRQVHQLAKIDRELATKVGDLLGLDVPAIDETEATPASDGMISPALSQVGNSWPLDGRMIGIAIGDNAAADTAHINRLRKIIDQHSMVPMIIAPTAAPLSDGTAVQRTYLTGRSVEYDAVIFVSEPSATPTKDASAAGTDSKVADPVGRGTVDPRLILLAAETFRHAKALGFAADSPVPAAAGIDEQAPGVFSGEMEQLTSQLFEALGKHRVWERFA